jgi:TRAP-type uncharacterized transport system fused permease subunit
VSPPTALSPFAAAAITGGDPYKTTLQTWKYTLPAFLVPFVFVLDPAGVGILLAMPKDGTVTDVVLVILTTGIGIAGLAFAAQNWLLRRLQLVERGLMLVAGVLLLFPGLADAASNTVRPEHILYPKLVGVALMALILSRQIVERKRRVAA